MSTQFGNPTRWPRGIVPYEFDMDGSALLKKKFLDATKIWEEQTCIRFEPYSPFKHTEHRSKVLIKNRGQ